MVVAVVWCSWCGGGGGVSIVPPSGPAQVFAGGSCGVCGDGVIKILDACSHRTKMVSKLWVF